MKKIRLLIPMLRKQAFEFYIFDLSFKNNSKGQLLLKYAYIFGYFFLFLAFFLTFFSDLFFVNIDKDTAVLKLLIWIVPISIALFLTGIILNGRRRIVDPPFFLAILLFALGITSSSVLVSVPSLGNTFGISGIRALAGVGIIAFISLYYLNGAYIHNRVLFRRAFKILIAGIYLYLLATFLSDYSALTSLDNITLAIAGLGGIFVLTKSSVNLRKFKASLAIVLVGVMLYSWINAKLNLVNLTYILVPGILSLIILIGTFLFTKKSLLKVLVHDTQLDLAKLMTRDLEFWELARIISVWLIVASPIVLLGILLIINSKSGNAFSPLITLLQNNLKAFNSIIDFSNGFNGSSFGMFMFGNGSASLQLSNSYISNVILAQGFLGLASYLFLATYGIMVGARFIYYSFKNNGSYIIPSLLLLIVSIVTFEGLLFYPGLKIIYLWWVCFSLISVKYVLKDKKKFLRFSDEDFKIHELKINGKQINRFAKYIVVLLIIIAAIYISSNFSQIIK